MSVLKSILNCVPVEFTVYPMIPFEVAKPTLASAPIFVMILMKKQKRYERDLNNDWVLHIVIALDI